MRKPFLCRRSLFCVGLFFYYCRPFPRETFFDVFKFSLECCWTFVGVAVFNFFYEDFLQFFRKKQTGEDELRGLTRGGTREEV